MIHYPITPHAQGAYREINLTTEDLPIAQQLASEVLSLPIYPHLTIDQQNQVVCEIIDLSPTIV